MRRFTLPAMVLLLALASPAPAQQWSAEQLEVWDVIQSQWAATMEKDASWPDRFLHDAFMGWGNDQPAPRSKDSQTMWSRYGMENSTTLVQELYPIAIMVEGNTAVAHYFYSTAAEDRKGDRETTSGRYTDVLLNDEGTWRFIAWQGGEEAEDD